MAKAYQRDAASALDRRERLLLHVGECVGSGREDGDRASPYKSRQCRSEDSGKRRRR